MQILICDPDKVRAQMWASVLLKELDCEVVITFRDENALAYIDTLPTLDLLIAPMEVGGRDVGLSIVNVLRQKSKSLKLIVFGRPEVKGDGIYHFAREPLMTTLLKCIHDIQQQVKTEAESPYRPIPLDLLKLLPTIPADIYFNLSTVSKEHFAKVFKGGTMNDPDKISEYTQKGVRHIWVTRDDFPLMMGEIFHFAEVADQAQMVVGPVDCDKMIFNCLLGLGQSEGKVETKLDEQKKQIQSLAKDLKNTEWGKNIFTGQGNYRRAHAMLTGIFASILLDEMPWSMPEHHRIVHTASMLMDIEIASLDGILVRNQADFDSLKILRGDKFAIINHAKVAAEKIIAIKKIPEDVARLVKCHHGTNLGVGFEIAREDQIYSFAWLFVFAEELSHFTLKHFRTGWENTQLATHIQSKFTKNKTIQKLLDKVLLDAKQTEST